MAISQTALIICLHVILDARHNLYLYLLGVAAISAARPSAARHSCRCLCSVYVCHSVEIVTKACKSICICMHVPNMSALFVCRALRRVTFMHCSVIVTRTNISLSSSVLIAPGPSLHRSIVLQADFNFFSTRTSRATSQLLSRQRLRRSLLKPSKMTGKASPPLRDSIMKACACRASTCVSLVCKAPGL